MSAVVPRPAISLQTRKEHATRKRMSLRKTGLIQAPQLRRRPTSYANTQPTVLLRTYASALRENTEKDSISFTCSARAVSGLKRIAGADVRSKTVGCVLAQLVVRWRSLGARIQIGFAERHPLPRFVTP